MDKSGLEDLSRLKRRLFVVLAAVALLLAAGGAFLHLSYRATLRAGAESLLRTTNQVKMDQLLAWREDRLSNTMSLLDSPVLSVHIRRFAAAPSDKATAALLRQRLEAYLRHNKYIFAAFTDRNGVPLVSAGPGTAERGCPNFAMLAAQARATGRPHMGDFYLPPGERSPHIDIVALAAAARAGKELFLVLRVDPAEFLYPLLKTWTAKGRTGEVLLVSRDEDSVLFLNDLRHVRDAAMRLRLPLGSETLPAALAAKGYSGFVRGKDYRGAAVLAAVGPVAGTSWAMVTKLDWDEVMQGTGAFGGLVALLVLALLAVSGSWAYMLFRRQAAAYERIKINYELFSEKANDGILVVDMATRTVLEANRRACEMYGYPPERMKGLKAEAVIPPGDLEVFRRRIAETVRAGGRVYEVSHLRADGTLFPAEISSSIVDVAGKATMFVIVRDITERRRAQELLARLTDQVPGVVYQYRLYPDGRSCFPYASSGMEMIYEVTPEEVREDATPVFGRLHPDDLKATSEAIFASARDLSVFHWEFRVVLPRQGLRWRLCDARPERLPDGGTLWHGIITDITDRKLAEQELHALSQQRELALSAARLGWWTYDPVSKIASYDARYREIFEVAGSSQPNEEILKRLHPEDLPGVWAKVEAALDPADPRPYSAEYRVVIPAGPVKWVEAHGLAIFEGEGKARRAVNFIGTVADITERRNAEEALRKSENAVRNKLNAIMSPEGDIGSIPLEDIFDIPALQRMMDDMYRLTRITSAILDVKGKVLVASGWQDICTKFHRVNPETCRHCLESDTILSRDIPPGEVRSYFCKNNMRDVATPLVVGGAHVGNFFLGQFLYEDDPHDTEKFREQARRYGFDEEEYLAAYDRIPVFSRRNVEVLISFYRQVAELISTLSYGKIKLARALAQSRQAELEKENLNKALAAKNREMENFLYITTHDLRSPLVNIQGFSQNLQHYLGEIGQALEEAGLPQERKEQAKKLTSEKVPEALGFVLESSAKMDALLSALLKVSRLGRQELKPETLEMGPSLTRIVDTMLFQVREAGAVINIGPLPACRADAASVSQLFSNLLDNAVKYRDDGRKLVVEISGETRGGMAVYRVADNGQGIPAADADRLWDVFYKPARSGQNKGEGIGLPMCRRIAEHNGGGIRVEANPGGGTVFVVELPAA